MQARGRTDIIIGGVDAMPPAVEAEEFTIPGLVDALVALAPQLAGEAQTQALTRGLEAALAIEQKWLRTNVLAGLVPAWQASRREIVSCFRAV